MACFHSPELSEIKLDELLTKLNLQNVSQTPALSSLAGLVVVNKLDFVYALNNRWFSEFDTDLQVDGLSVMNNAFPQMKITTELVGHSLQASLNSQDKAWVLTGGASLNAKYVYRMDLTVKANSEEFLPDWAYLMKKKSALSYTALFQGRLF